ncbi:MAG: hypothetical protein ABI619_09230, partial [Betaproteobacteria bacterium]
AGRLCGLPFVSGPGLLVTDDDGKAIVVRLDNGKIVRELQLETGAIPVAASIPFGNGRILTPLADGTLSWHDFGSAKVGPAKQAPAQPGDSQ